MWQSRKEKEIWLVCNTLREQGVGIKEITAAAIGSLLVEQGMRAGSYSTRYKYRETWANEQANTVAAHNQGDLEQVKLTGELGKYKALMELRDREIKTLNIQHQRQQQQQKKANIVWQNKILRLESRIRGLEKQLATTTVEYSEQLAAKDKAHSIQLLEAERHLHRIKSNMGDTVALAERIDELLAEQTTLKAEIEKHKVENSWLKKDKARLLGCLENEA